MSMTVRRLAANPRLGLSLVGGLDGGDRLVSWAHAIELPDPTPWLSGGELVMTTGLRLGDTDTEQYEYVARLAQAGIAALAFDTGIQFDDVPPAVKRAGDTLGFAILRVPPKTPFIAISRAVIDELTADQLRTVQQVVDTQERLARAAVHKGMPAVIATLGRAINATVCALDRTGQSLAESGPGSRELAVKVRGRLERERRRITGSRVIADAAGVVTIHPLSTTGDPNGYLAISSAEPLGTSERLLIGHAVALLSMELAKPARVVDAEQRLRLGVTRLLVGGDNEVDAGLMRYFGFDVDSTVAVAVLTDVGPLLPAQRSVGAALDDEGVPYLMDRLADGNGVAFAVDAAALPDMATRVYDRVRTQLQRSISGGVGNAAPISSMATSLRQALSAGRVGRAQGRTLVHINAVSTFGLLLGLQDEEVLQTLAASGLRVLEDHDTKHSTSLVTTLEAFLGHNGQWEVAAASLGVHRHTLRNRMDKVIELLGRDMDSAHTRAELWISLKARELLRQQ